MDGKKNKCYTAGLQSLPLKRNHCGFYRVTIEVVSLKPHYSNLMAIVGNFTCLHCKGLLYVHFPHSNKK